MSKKRFHRNHGRPSQPHGNVQAPTAVTAQPAAPSDDARPEASAPDAVEARAPHTADAEAAMAAGTADAADRHGPAPTATASAPSDVPAAVPLPAPDANADIRGVLIQVAGARLLLPNATIAEVLSYADPDPVAGDAPDWLLGRMRWRGWHLPLIAFGRLADVAEEKAGLGNKVVVLKALAGNARTPYIAMLTQGFPRLVTVSRDALRLDEATDPMALPRGIQARVFLNDDEALLPDLDAIEALVAEADSATQAA